MFCLTILTAHVVQCEDIRYNSKIWFVSLISDAGYPQNRIQKFFVDTHLLLELSFMSIEKSCIGHEVSIVTHNSS